MNEPLLNRAFSRRERAGVAQPSSEADPFDELSRLVGEDDPFRDMLADSRGPQGQAARPNAGHAPAGHAPAGYAQPAAPRASDRQYEQDYEEYALRQEYGLSGEGAPYEDGGAEAGYDDLAAQADYYDEDPELGPDISLKKRRTGLVIAGIITAAVIGGASYAFYQGDDHQVAGGAPPVIHADSGPTKTVPEPKAGDASAQHGKLIYDRIGAADKPGDEKVVPRVEEPVDLPNPGTDTAQSTPAAPPASALAPAGSPNAEMPTAGEPRRVRTVLIRPDGSMGDDAAGAPAPAGRPAATVSGAQPVAPGGYPFSIIENDDLARPGGSMAQQPEQQASAPVPDASVPMPPTKPAAPVSSVERAAPPPARVATPAPAAAQPQRVASAQPAPATTASIATSAPTRGGFAVQLTSQRSEQEARAAYAALQRRFPSVLASAQPSIQRADLGSRGIYYRVKVAASSRESATQLCASLKAQGGDCVVGN